MSKALRWAGWLAAAVLLILCGPAVLHAQHADSVALEHSIAAEHPDLPVPASARLRLMRQLHSNDIAGVHALLAFMQRRSASWLTPAERLIAETLIADSALLRDVPYLDGLLGGAETNPKQNSAYADQLYQYERDLLRDRAEGLEDRFTTYSPNPDELFFFNLLVNHLYAHGYHAQEALNSRVGNFTARYPASALGPLAERYIRKSYGEVPAGVAFTAGYAIGVFSGDISRRFNYFDGPMIGGEVYVYDVTLAAWLDFGIAKAPLDFQAGGRLWPAGSASLVNGAFDLGYQIRLGRLAITPVAGLALQSLRGIDSAGADPQNLPRTHDRLGLDLGVIVGYRIPFDLGPHIDFRIKLGRASTALGDYDAGFSGTLWYAQLAFALVERPYEGR